METVEHKLTSCIKYEYTQSMLAGLQRLAPVENRVEDLLGCGDTVGGREVIFRFLINTELIKRL